MFEVKPWHGVALALLALATPAHAADRNVAKA